MMGAQLPLGSTIVDAAGAKFSEDSRHRFLLWRRWHNGPQGSPLWIGANPSIATADILDPTIRREIAFSRAWGYGGMVKANLFSLISTDPRGLDATDDRERWPDTDAHLADAIAAAPLVIAAWGVGTGKEWFRERSAEVLAMIRSSGQKAQCLGRTKDGAPRHPLYLAAATPLEEL